jgi:Fic family protein
MLFATPPLSTRELEVVNEIDQLRRNLQFAVTQSRRWTGLLRRSTFARAIQGSNSIEGYVVTIEDAIAAAAGEAPADADAATWAAIAGYRSALTYALQLADDPHFSYSAGLLRALHFMMIQHDLTKHPGRWRAGPIFVRNDERGEVVYEGPDAQLVPPLMTELVAWLERGDLERPALVRAAMGHLNLVMIHPFSDGNGRMARCLQTLMLARERILAPHFCSIEEYLGRHTPDYYAVLSEAGAGKWNPARDAQAWVRFALRAHYFQASTLLRRNRELSRIWDQLEQETVRYRLPDRVLLALSDAAMGWRVRNGTYRTAAEITDHTAGRDLKLLVSHKLLVARGERRGRWYEASPLVIAIRERCKEDRKISDPFEAPGRADVGDPLP